ncbi:hypothetical protein MHN28_17810 [Ruegeria sp. Ofav3-42]|nr:hypothetical protein [Ruegeria sp. Ofav3-42]
MATLGRHREQAFTGWGDAFSEVTQYVAQHSRVQQENQKLRERVRKLTTRPRVPGIYGDRNARSDTGPIHSANGSAGGGSGDNSDIGSTHGIAPGREVEKTKYSSGPGFTEISNRLGTMVVPGADGEPWGIDEVITAAAAVPFNAAYWAGQKIGNFLDNRRYNNVVRSAARAQKGYQTKRRYNHAGRSLAPTRSEIDAYRMRRRVLNGL